MARKPPKLRKTAAQVEADRIARRQADLESVSLPAEAATLSTYTEVEVTRTGQAREGRKVEGDQARRHDAFSALRTGMAAGCYDAARRFELDLLTRHGLADRGRSMERVDCTAGPTTDAVIAAAQRIEQVQDRIPPRDFWLLCELIVPPIDRGTWRDHVGFITGESHPNAQGAVVRAVVVNLRDAYVAIERRVAA